MPQINDSAFDRADLPQIEYNNPVQPTVRFPLFAYIKCPILLIYKLIIYYILVKINNKITKEPDFFGLFYSFTW